jgi:peptidoglycan/LPS O-acetylase OafA/YrhL
MQEILIAHLMRDPMIDFLKGIACLSVILTHTFDRDTFLSILGPFHINQAVPIFIIIAGYNGALFYQRRNFLFSDCLKRYYDPSILFHRIKRIILPFSLIWMVQILIIIYFSNIELNLGIEGLVASFLTGGWGPGSYFVPVILQHILLLPILYYIAMRGADRMILIAFILNLLFEYYAAISCMQNDAYRLLYPRYLFAGALGVWIAFGGVAKHKGLLIFGAIMGLAYTAAVEYYNIHLYFINPSWYSQNLPSFMWPFILVFIVIKLGESSEIIRIATDGKLVKIMSLPGQASYHIFLSQMVYFWAIHVVWTNQLVHLNNVTTNISICILIGMFFYGLDLGMQRLYLFVVPR